MKTAPIPAWLHKATSALVEDIVRMLVKRHANILLVVILFGSVAAMKSALLTTPAQVMWTWDSMFLDNLADHLNVSVREYLESVYMPP